MGPTAKALNKTASQIKDINTILNHSRKRLDLAASAAVASSFTYPLSSTHFHTKTNTTRPPKRDFHSGGAHPTRGFFFGRSKDKDTSSATTDDTRAINHLQSVSYSFSPINPGQARYHYGDDYIPPPRYEPIPEPEPHIAPNPTAEELNLLFSTNVWSLSLANAGEFYPNWAFPDPAERLERAANKKAAAAAAASSESDSSTRTTDTKPAMGDEEYAAFLDKASADREPQASTQSASLSNKAKHTTVTTSSVPGSLKNLKATYTSDSDEPFEPVSLDRKSKSGELTAEEVTELIGAKKGAVSEIDVKSFDPRGEYTKVFGAIEGAVGKDAKALKVFKVEAGGARVEYWILGAAIMGEQHVVGAKALSVES